ncbi:peptidoglycan DD-metalloendopeptidase family protein [Telluribacter sp.]|jgi:murein DD-endopeptidase MepM/ murein hydrolase activator NlpD|uniref:peptidoglycan DD-metalloendopeptidase family protein n=1 Tax=Telluribacter sp. TaxID=1978767 RepID=UPI002E166080|nr:peptidoglycan DD-metalloendopeptidase family protein [Telluribacter sp.]
MNLSQLLPSYAFFAPIVPLMPYRWLDFTATNPDLPALDLTDTAVFNDYVFGKLLDNGRYAGVGGYDEHRVIYSRSAHFGSPGQEPRSIHLGIDIWAGAGTPVSAPLAGRVHSFAFNDNFGDYGPTIILEHELETIRFYTLYGHLTLASLDGLYEGKAVAAGEAFTAIGPYPENGHWPPHLHFQVMADIGTYRGDYPGVCSVRERDKYLALCPDPNLILRVPARG